MSSKVLVFGLASALLATASCAPAPSTVDSPTAGRLSTAAPDAASCAKAGGVLKPVGRLQTFQCVISYADAGKSCTSGDQCQGDCRAAPDKVVDAGQAIAGVCQATSDRFGCYTKVENGRALSTICVD